MGLGEITNLVGGVGKAIDTNTESGEERSLQQSVRHKVDMQSDSWLSKNIRPMTLIFLMLCEFAIILGSLFGVVVDLTITSQVGVLLFGAFSFYFNSKKAERIADKNSKTNLEMKKMQLKADIKRERREKRRK